MLLLRSASRACLRAFLLACAVAVGSFTSVRAETVDLKFTGTVTHWNGTTTTGSSAGRYNWDVMARSGPSISNTLFPASKAWTFCIEQNQYISGGNTYRYEIKTTLSGLPNPPGGQITPAREATLQALANLMGQASFYAQFAANTVQEAIWRIVAGQSVQDASLASQIAAMELAMSNNTATLLTKFFGLANGFDINNPNPNQAQDQIILGTYDERGFGGSILPTPTGVVMAGMGVVCLGGINLLRRRKKLAVI